MGRNLPMFLNAPRADHIVQVQMPSFGGLTPAGQVSAGEGTTGRCHGLRAVYVSSPL